MTPLVALVLGILIGWVLEWLLELFFFRRNRLECQRRLAELEVALGEREAQLKAARARIDSLEIDVANFHARVAVPGIAGEVTAPEVSIEAPDLTMAAPNLSVDVPDVSVKAPDVSFEAPDLSIDVPDLPVEAPDVSFETPDLLVDVPDVSLRTPDVAFQTPDLLVDVPDLPNASLRAGVPEVLAGAVTGAAVTGLGAGPGREKKIRCPQDLSRIDGIGTVYEQRLYKVGIGSFWDVARAGDDFLKDVLGTLVDIDLSTIKAHALRLAETTGTMYYSWDGTEPDDFETFPGIGEVYESRLYEAGICTYEALADCTVEQLQAICKAPEMRPPPYTEWIARAKRLASQKG